MAKIGGLAWFPPASSKHREADSLRQMVMGIQSSIVLNYVSKCAEDRGAYFDIFYVTCLSLIVKIVDKAVSAVVRKREDEDSRKSPAVAGRRPGALLLHVDVLVAAWKPR